MNLLKTLLCPGYLHWRQGKRIAAVCWMLPFLALAAVMLYKVSTHDLNSHSAKVALEYWETEVDITDLRWLFVVGFYLLTGLVTYFDHAFRTAEKNTDSASTKKVEKYDHPVWENILGVYLKNDTDKTLLLVEKQISKDKKDPFPYLIVGRILAQRGERQKALKAVRKCQKFDKNNYLKYECDQLIAEKQLEN